MCSVNEEDLDTLPEINIHREPLSDICKKCSSKATVLLRKKDVYCVSCFTTTVNHKFRAGLGKNKTIRAHKKILLAISGKQASSVLLNLLHNGISDNSHKKLRVEAACVYISDKLRGDSCMKNGEFVLEQCKQYGLPLYIVHLSSILYKDSSILEANTMPSIDPAFDEKLDTLIKSISSETSRRDFRTKLRRSLLIRCAGQLECDFILTGEISTSLASTMLSNLSLGRGAQIENDIGFCDSRDPIKILKPIKDLTLEEVEIYVNLKNISHIGETSAAGSSIQSTIKKFVVDLQENFPATISTICKTGEKMGGHADAADITSDKCVLCQSALDTQELKSSALQATNFSHLVSSTGPNHIQPSSAPGPSSTCVNCDCSKQQISREQVEQFVCYGCRLIVRDVKGNDLPTHFHDLVKTTITMAKLRSQINDFLI